MAEDSIPTSDNIEAWAARPIVDVDEAHTAYLEQQDTKLEEDEETYLIATEWWLAATAFPLLAGTFGPLASAFSINALVVPWRETENGDPISDPAWIVILNAVQLGIALMANLFLLLNMGRSVSFSVAQPITIGGWYISSFVLIGLCATAAGPISLPGSGNRVYSQAFYYGIMSAVLYLIVATLMLVTAIGALMGKYKKSFQLTDTQRTLMLQTISFLVYLEVGAAIYTQIEGWPFLKAVYWADVTLLTIGFGDVTPKTSLGRALLFPFAVVGILFLGLVVGSIRSLILDLGSAKIAARIVERERERVVRTLAEKDSELLMPIVPDLSGVSSAESRFRESERRRHEFEIMRRAIKHAHSKRRWTTLLISGLTWFLLWLAGAAVFQAAERGAGNWTYFVSVYFSFVSLVTIGYGDYYPTSNSAIAFFVLWSILAIPALTIVISNMGDTVAALVNDWTIALGKITILPGDEGIVVALKQGLKNLSHGEIYIDGFRLIPPGFLGDVIRHGFRRKKRRHARQELDSEGPTGQAGEGLNMLNIRSREHYHCVLIDEIARVTGHLNSDMPKEYSYDEWAWYLKLIGEDESYGASHTTISNSWLPAHQSGQLQVMKKHETHDEENWSWLDIRSPLMSSLGESEWILERLTETLRRELRAANRERESSSASIDAVKESRDPGCA